MEDAFNFELEERATKVIGSCLYTSVVLRQFLQHFSDKELIELSLVNKQWNYEARSVLRERGTLTAEIKSGDRRRGLAAFATDLEKMRLVPFSGIKVPLYPNRVRQSAPNESNNNVILQRLRVKKLSIDFFPDWDKSTDSPLLLLVKGTLENFSEILQVLSFTFRWEDVHRLPHFCTSWSFPRLKILKLETENIIEDFTKFVKKLVSCAPCLQDLQMVGQISFEENVLEGSSAVLVPCYSFNPLYERVAENLISALRPETIQIYSRHYLDIFNEEILTRLIPKMLRVSVNTLHTLKMDFLFAVPLMCYGICLENVTTLEIRLALRILESLEPRTLALLKRFDFSRVFPKVDKVEIENESNKIFTVDAIDAFFEQGNALLLTESLQDRAINIKQMTIRYFKSDSTILFLSQMFPDVKRVSIETRDYIGPTPFPSMWDHFRGLEELILQSSARPRWTENLDSLFCGVFPEEVAELREQDDEYLKAVNIVPIMPSITCMKNLRTFTFQYTPEKMPGSGVDTFWFSKVAGFIGFARCPSLHVTFQTRSRQCGEALRHMEPFASFVSLDD